MNMKWPMYISLMPATLMVRCAPFSSFTVKVSPTETLSHFGEPFGDYRAIVDQYLWLVCFAVA